MICRCWLKAKELEQAIDNIANDKTAKISF